MSVPSTEMLRLLAAAVELRAAGKSWEAVAERLGRAAATCRCWPKRFRCAWDDLYEAAESKQMAEGRAEATSVLRTQLRLEDTKEKRDAAKALLASANRHRTAKSKRGEKSIDEFADQLSNAQVQDITPEAGPAAGGDGAPNGAAGRRTKPV